MELSAEYTTKSGVRTEIYDGTIAKAELIDGDEISLKIGQHWVSAEVQHDGDKTMLDVHLGIEGERYLGRHALTNALINGPSPTRRKPFKMGANFSKSIEDQGIDTADLPLFELSNGRVRRGTPAVIRRGNV